MSAKEYNIWLADHLIEPWGEERADLRAGTIVKSNIMPYSKKDVKLKDCVLNFEPPKNQDWRDWQKALHDRTRALGGKVL
jgi:hypothetical protein